MARILGAQPCHPLELRELNKPYPSYRYFRVMPIYDAHVDHPHVYWKWPVVQPEDGTVYMKP
jgi:hypothetical protein